MHNGAVVSFQLHQCFSGPSNAHPLGASQYGKCHVVDSGTSRLAIGFRSQFAAVYISPGSSRCYYWGREILDKEKMDVDKFGSPPSWQMFPSVLRMLCAKMQ